MAHEDDPSLPESYWNALRRSEPNERAVDHAYFRFTIERTVRRPPPRVIHWLVFGFVAGVAAVSAAASGLDGLLRWLPLVPHESRASWVHPSKHRLPTSGSAPALPAASASAVVNPVPTAAPTTGP
jgi:hypothetical protein